MSDNSEKQCYICVATNDKTEGELIEQHAPDFGIKGGIYLCKKHSREMKAR